MRSTTELQLLPGFDSLSPIVFGKIVVPPVLVIFGNLGIADSGKNSGVDEVFDFWVLASGQANVHVEGLKVGAQRVENSCPWWLVLHP